MILIYFFHFSWLVFLHKNLPANNKIGAFFIFILSISILEWCSGQDSAFQWSDWRLDNRISTMNSIKSHKKTTRTARWLTNTRTVQTTGIFQWLPTTRNVHTTRFSHGWPKRIIPTTERLNDWQTRIILNGRRFPLTDKHNNCPKNQRMAGLFKTK